MISFDTVTSYISISVLSNNSNRRILNDEIKFHATHLSFMIFDDDQNQNQNQNQFYQKPNWIRCHF